MALVDYFLTWTEHQSLKRIYDILQAHGVTEDNFQELTDSGESILTDATKKWLTKNEQDLLHKVRALIREYEE